MPLWDDAGIHRGHGEGTYSPGCTKETRHITEAHGPNKTQRTVAKLGNPRTTAPPAEGAWQERPHGPQGNQAGCPTGHQRSPQQAVSLAPPAAKAALSAPRGRRWASNPQPHIHTQQPHHLPRALAEAPVLHPRSGVHLPEAVPGFLPDTGFASPTSPPANILLEISKWFLLSCSPS